MSWLGKARFRLSGLLVDRFLSFDTAEFARTLSEMGISKGDVLMVHSSLHAHSGYRDKPVDMIAALKKAVGPEGLLVMPSMTYADSSKAFLLRREAMKVRYSPSRMGLLTEVFRRGKGVRRSLSPTHPLLAWGDRAAMFLAGHNKTDRAFGPESPFRRLLDLDGKILCLGTIPETVTFTHFLEDRIAGRLPFPLYDSDLYVGTVVDEDGQSYSVPTLVLSDESRHRRCENLLWKEAKAKGLIRKKRVGNTTLMLMTCRDLAELFDDLYATAGGTFGNSGAQ